MAGVRRRDSTSMKARARSSSKWCLPLLHPKVVILPTSLLKCTMIPQIDTLLTRSRLQLEIAKQSLTSEVL
eukprot:scaffold93038_cov42-Cyclotella_meneghiniana.AAC.3